MDNGIDDVAYNSRQENDHNRLQQGCQAFSDHIDLFVVSDGDAVKHLFKVAGLFANSDHVAHHGREGAGLLEGA